MLEVRCDRPFGSVSPHKSFDLDAESEVKVDESIELHIAMARRWKRNFEAKTGVRVKKEDARTKLPFSRDDIAKRVKAASFGKTEGWQDKETVTADGARTAQGEKESGGTTWYGNREEMGKYADSIGIDLDAVEKSVKDAAGKRTAFRLLYPASDEPNLEATDDGLVLARRTAMNATTNPEATAIDYLHEYQFVISQAGKLIDLMGEEFDIPNGAATKRIPRLGYAQMYKAAEVTGEAYAANVARSPSTAYTEYIPFKLWMAVWASGEFDEDSIAPWIAAIQRAMQLGRGIALDHMILRGHTALDTTNINSFGITALGNKDPRTCANGFQGSNWVGTHFGGAANAFKGINMGGAAANLNMVPAMRAKLNKYGIDRSALRLVCGATTVAQFIQDAKARPDTYSLLLEKRGDTLYLDGIEVVEIADSKVTNASTGGLPDYDGWNLEGNPVNLAADGTYTGAGNSYTTATLVNTRNWLLARKRQFVPLVVRLPLADQLAITGGERLDVRPLHPNVSELVAYGIAA